MKSSRKRLLSLFLTVLMAVQFMPLNLVEALSDGVAGPSQTSSGIPAASIPDAYIMVNWIDEDVKTEVTVTPTRSGNPGSFVLDEDNKWTAYASETGMVTPPPSEYTYDLEFADKSNEYSWTVLKFGRNVVFNVMDADKMFERKIDIEWTDISGKAATAPVGLTAVKAIVTWYDGYGDDANVAGTKEVEVSFNAQTQKWESTVELPRISGKTTFEIDTSTTDYGTYIKDKYSFVGYISQNTGDVHYIFTEINANEDKDEQSFPVLVTKRWVNINPAEAQQITVMISYKSGTEGGDNPVLPGDTSEDEGTGGGSSGAAQTTVTINPNTSTGIAETVIWVPAYDSLGQPYRDYKVEETGLGDSVIELENLTNIVWETVGGIQRPVSAELYNTLSKKITVDKVWRDEQGRLVADKSVDYDSIPVRLYDSNGNFLEETTITRTGTTWNRAIFEGPDGKGYPLADENGNPINYTVAEGTPTTNGSPRYEIISSTVDGSAPYGFTVTNVLKAVDSAFIDVVVHKTWLNVGEGENPRTALRVESRDGGPSYSENSSDYIYYNANNPAETIYTFEDLDRYYTENGVQKERQYSVSEFNSTAGYTLISSSQQKDADGNIHWYLVNDKNQVNVKAEKVWVDGDADTTLRPDIIVYLMRDGVKLYNASDVNTHKYRTELGGKTSPDTTTLFDLSDLPLDDGSNHVYTYSIEEYVLVDGVEVAFNNAGTGYVRAETGASLTATNVYVGMGEGKTPLIALTKEWIGTLNDDEEYPEVVIQLYGPNNQLIYEWTVEAGTKRVITEYLPEEYAKLITDDTGYYLVEKISGEELGYEWINGGTDGKTPIIIGEIGGHRFGSGTIVNRLKGSTPGDEERDLYLSKEWRVSWWPTGMTRDQYIAQLSTQFRITRSSSTSAAELVTIINEMINSSRGVTIVGPGIVEVTGNGFLALEGLPAMDGFGVAYTYVVEEIGDVKGFKQTYNYYNGRYEFFNDQIVVPIKAQKTFDLTEYPDVDLISAIGDSATNFTLKVIRNGTDEVFSYTLKATDWAKVGKTFVSSIIDMGVFPTGGWNAQTGEYEFYSYTVKESFEWFPGNELINFDCDWEKPVNLNGELVELQNVYAPKNNTVSLTLRKQWLDTENDEITPPDVTVNVYRIIRDGSGAITSKTLVDGSPFTLSASAQDPWRETVVVDVGSREAVWNAEFLIEETHIAGQEINDANYHTVYVGTGKDERAYRFISAESFGNYLQVTNRKVKLPSEFDMIEIRAWKMWDLTKLQGYYAGMEPPYDKVDFELDILLKGKVIETRKLFPAKNASVVGGDWFGEPWYVVFKDVPLYHRDETTGELIELEYQLREVNVPSGFVADFPPRGSLTWYLNENHIKGTIRDAASDINQEIELSKGWLANMPDALKARLKVYVTFSDGVGSYTFELSNAKGWTQTIELPTTQTGKTYTISEKVVYVNDNDSETTLYNEPDGDTLNAEYTITVGNVVTTSNVFNLKKQDETGSVTVHIDNPLDMTTEISGTKTYKGDRAYISMADGKPVLTIKLSRVPAFAAGDTDTFTITPENMVETPANSGIYTWKIENLPKYDSVTGKEYVYSVESEILTDTPWYVVTITGNNLVNEPEVIEYDWQKTWEDDIYTTFGIEKENIRNQYPATGTKDIFELQRRVKGSTNDADYVKVPTGEGDFTVTVDSQNANIWRLEATGLLKYVKGSTTPAQEYEYRFVEKMTGTTGYEVVTGANGFTNTAIETGLTGYKRWHDEGNAAARPTELWLSLQRALPDAQGRLNFVEMGAPYDEFSVTPSNVSGNEWTFTLAANLPRYGWNGTSVVPYTYKFVELTDKLNGYAPKTGKGEAIATTRDQTNVNWLENELKPFSITGSKTWNDAGEASRPTYLDVTVTQYRKDTSVATGFTKNYRIVTGTPTAPTEIQAQRSGTGNMNWAFEITDLPQYLGYEDGVLVEYSYTITEVVPKGYTANGGTVTIDDKGTLVNDLTPITLYGVKYWNDSNNAFGIRPETLSLTIWQYKTAEDAGANRNGTNVGTLVVPTDVTNTDVNGYWRWSKQLNLPKYVPGTESDEYVYVFVEDTTALANLGYEAVRSRAIAGVNAAPAEGNAYTLENKPITTGLAVEKKWVDDNDSQGIRPSFVSLTLKYTYPGLVGDPITYTAYNNGGVVRVEATKDAATNWKYTIENTDLPAYGWNQEKTAIVKYTYSFEEAVAPLGYDKDVYTDGIITNTLITIPITGEKIWDDNGNALGMRPTSLNYKLVYSTENDITTAKTVAYSGKTYTTESVTGSTTAASWPIAIANSQLLPKYGWDGTTDANGNPVAKELYYWFVEVDSAVNYEPAGYTATEPTALAKQFKADAALENALETTKLTGIKRWNDANNEHGTRPESLTVTLYRYTTDSTKMEKVGDYIINPKSPATGTTVIVPTMQPGDDYGLWNWTLDGPFPRYSNVAKDANGQNIPYTYVFVEEGQSLIDLKAKNYEPVTGTAKAGIVEAGTPADQLVNRLTQLSVTGIKHWVDAGVANLIRPSSLTMAVYKEIEGGLAPVNLGSGSNVFTYTPSAAEQAQNEWKWTINGLDFADANGQIKYVFVEYDTNLGVNYVPAGYTATKPTSKSNDESSYLENTVQTVNLSGRKQWVDKENIDTRPSSLFVELFRYEKGKPNTRESLGVYEVQLNGTNDAANKVARGTLTTGMDMDTWTWTLPGNFQKYAPTTVGNAEKVLYIYEYVEQRANLTDYEPAPTSTTTANAYVSGDSDYDQNAALKNVLATVTLNGAKLWDDEGHTQVRPATLTVTLRRYLKDDLNKVFDNFSKTYTIGTEASSAQNYIRATENPAGRWSWTLNEKLPLYQNDTTNAYEYVFVEDANADNMLAYIANKGTAVAGVNGAAAEALENGLETVTLGGRKQWEDFGDPENDTRPDSITVKLMRYLKGQAQTTAEVVPGADALVISSGSNDVTNWQETQGTGDPIVDEWSWKFAGEFPKYGAHEIGNITAIVEYVYFYEEVKVNGYEAVEPSATASIGDLASDEALYNKLETTEIDGIKVWEDQENLYDTRTDYEVLLYRYIATETRPAVPYTSDTFGPDEPWSFTNLPKYDKAGNEYIYEPDETQVTGYDVPVVTEEAPWVITNNLLTREAGGTKYWIGDANYPFERPTAIIVQLMWRTDVDGEPQPVYQTDADGVQQIVTQEITIGENTTGGANGMPDGTWLFEDLPIVDANGVAYIYSIEEIAQVFGAGADRMETPFYGYTSRVEGMDGFNTIKTGNLQGTKHWNDYTTAEYDTRPESVLITLTRQHASGDADTEFGTNGEMTFLIENTGTGNDHAWFFNDLPIVDRLSTTGASYKYFIEEVAVAGNYEAKYEAEVTAAVSSGAAVVITNDLQTVKVNVDKIWGDRNHTENRPATIDITLTATGATDEQVYYEKTVTLDVSNLKKFSFTEVFENVPIYDLKGNELVLEISESGNLGMYVQPPTVSHPESGDDGEYYGLIENNLTDGITVSGQKHWFDTGYDENRPDFIEIQLRRKVVNGTDNAGGPVNTDEAVFGDDTAYDRIDLDNDNWQWSYGNLEPNDIYGNEYVYYVVEKPIPGYTTTPVEGDPMSLENLLDEVDLEGDKQWILYGHEYMLPESVTFTVYRGTKDDAVEDYVPYLVGNDPLTVRLPDNGNWTWSIKDLPFGTKDEQFQYIMVETEVVGFKPIREGGSIINDLETVDITVNKDWTDAYWNDALQPDSIWITVRSVNDSTNFEPQQLELSGTNWSDTFVNLPKYTKGGELAIYELSEAVDQAGKPIPFYLNVTGTAEVKVGDADEYTVDFENTLETVDIEVGKDWQEGEYGYEELRSDITVILTMDNSETFVPQTKTLTAPDWKDVFENLPKYNEDGELAEYRLSEATDAQGNPIPYYVNAADILVNVTANGTVYEEEFTNVQETVSITVNKDWTDDYWDDALQPGSIWITVSSTNDTDFVPQQLELNARNTWSDTFAGLPKYTKGGDLAIYELSEAVDQAGNPIPFYVNVTGTATVEVDEEGNEYGVDFENALDTVEIEVTKEWDEHFGENIYGDMDLRPTSITIILTMDNDATFAPQTVTLTPDDWTDTFTNLPRYNSQRELAVYKLTEALNAQGDPIPYYIDTIGEVTVEVDAEQDTYEAAFLNLQESLIYNVTKNWENLLDRDFTAIVDLLKDGVAIETVKFDSADGQQTYTFKPVPKYELVNGQVRRPVYEVKEQDDSGFTSTSGMIHDGNTYAVSITNRGHDLMSLKLTKKWSDVNSTIAQAHRPSEIVFTVTSTDPSFGTNGTMQVRLTGLKTAANWTEELPDLPGVHATTGEPVTYTVTEATVAGYEPSDGQYSKSVTYDGKDTYEVAFENVLMTLDLEVTKEYVGENNNRGLRPTSTAVTVTLKGTASNYEMVYANQYLLVSNSSTTGKITVRNLPRYSPAGDLIQYEVGEVAVPGYKLVTADSILRPTPSRDADKYEAKLVNELETIQHTVTKIWQNLEGRNYTVTVDLMRGNQIVQSTTFNSTAGLSSSFTFNPVPKYEKDAATGNVTRITNYTIVERNAAAFNATYQTGGTEDRPTVTITNRVDDPPTDPPTTNPPTTNPPTTSPPTTNPPTTNPPTTNPPTTNPPTTSPPTTPPTTTPPTTVPTPTPRPTPRIVTPPTTPNRPTTGITTYEIDDFEIPLGAGLNLNQGDCFD